MQAEIITIGDEILIGQVVDTNSSWIARELNLIGVSVVQMTSVSDDPQHIIQTLDEASGRADILLMTGGLGPTRDDITKKTLAKYFNSEMEMDLVALEMVKEIFRKRNLPLLDINEMQALLPVKCTPLYNKIGTAPGMWFERENKVFISMPGVPYEMKTMMEQQVIPMLKDRFEFPVIRHRTFLTSGIGESFLAKRIESLEDALPSHIKLAYLPNLSTVRLRFSAKGENLEHLDAELDDIASRLNELAGEYLAADGDRKLQEVVGSILLQKKATVSTAESCTGGMVAHLITMVPGSSAWFKGAVVSYSNEVKVSQLGVKEETLQAHGAVSRETVEQMASGVRVRLQTTYAIAISGIAGPGGGSSEKPVGTVWIAVAGPEGIESKEHLLFGQREQIIERSALLGLEMLRKVLVRES